MTHYALVHVECHELSEISSHVILYSTLAQAKEQMRIAVQRLTLDLEDMNLVSDDYLQKGKDGLSVTYVDENAISRWEIKRVNVVGEPEPRRNPCHTGNRYTH